MIKIDSILKIFLMLLSTASNKVSGSLKNWDTPMSLFETFRAFSFVSTNAYALLVQAGRNN